MYCTVYCQRNYEFLLFTAAVTELSRQDNNRESGNEERENDKKLRGQREKKAGRKIKVWISEDVGGGLAFGGSLIDVCAQTQTAVVIQMGRIVEGR